MDFVEVDLMPGKLKSEEPKVHSKLALIYLQLIYGFLRWKRLL